MGVGMDSVLGARRVEWAVGALIGALVADLVETFVDPITNGDDPAKVYDAAAAHHGAMVTAGVLLLVTAFLIVPGVVGASELVGRRGQGLAIAARVLALLGGMGHAALGAIYFLWAEIPGRD